MLMMMRPLAHLMKRLGWDLGRIIRGNSGEMLLAYAGANPVARPFEADLHALLQGTSSVIVRGLRR